MFLMVVCDESSVTLAAVVIFWVTFAVKRSLAGVNVVRWVATAVTPDVGVEGTATDPGSVKVPEHHSTDYKHKKKHIWCGIFSSCSSCS